MRTKVMLMLIVSFFPCLALGQRKTPLDDPQIRQQVVLKAFKELANGVYEGSTEKYVPRLGDSVAPDLMKIISAAPLNDKDVKGALAVLNMAFQLPRNIRHDSDRTPTHSLALLDYLDAHVVDANLKAKINSVRTRLKLQPIPDVPN